MPIDAEPNEAGNLVLVDGKARSLTKDLFSEVAVGPRYMPHHATCPDVEMFRKKKKR